MRGGEQISHRFLRDGEDEIYIRDVRLIKLKNTVWDGKKYESVSSIASPLRPYGLRGDAMLDYKKYKLPKMSETPIKGGYEVLGLINLKRMWMYIPKDYPLPKKDGLLGYKVLITRNYGNGDIGECPAQPIVAKPGQLCTETFIQIGDFSTEMEARNLLKYIKTKFFRALVAIVKQDQNAAKSVYRYVPLQDFTNQSDIDWIKPVSDIDEQLFRKYQLDSDEISFIKDNIQEMS